MAASGCVPLGTFLFGQEETVASSGDVYREEGAEEETDMIERVGKR